MLGTHPSRSATCIAVAIAVAPIRAEQGDGMEMVIFSLSQHPTIGRVFERHPHARGAGFADDLALLTALKVSELRQFLTHRTLFYFVNGCT